MSIIYEMGVASKDGSSVIEKLKIRAGLSYWWMTLLAEKCNFAKSTWINDAIRCLAFYEWAKNKPLQSIQVVSANNVLSECIQSYCIRRGIHFEFQKHYDSSSVQSLTTFRIVFSLLPLRLQAILWFINYFVNRLPLRGVGLNEWRSSNSKITFVSYLFNQTNSPAETGQFQSRYWGNLPDKLLENEQGTNWLHIFLKDRFLPSAPHAAEAIKAMNLSHPGIQNHVTLDAFLGFKVLAKTLLDWARIQWASRKVSSILQGAVTGHSDIWPLMRNDWCRSIYGIDAISNLLYLNLHEQAIMNLPKQSLAIYLEENQAWEFGFIHAWKLSENGKILGCPHSTVRYWDLRYFYDPRSYTQDGPLELPMPTAVICNGPAMKKELIEGNYPPNNICDAEALRYSYLENTNHKIQEQSGCYGNSAVRTLLVLCDYLESNTRNQLAILEAAQSEIAQDIHITVKPHPGCPIRKEDYPNLKMEISDLSVSILLTECSAVYASAVTSAAVDSYCAGIPTIVFVDANELNLSPLRGMPHVHFASSAEDLSSKINIAVLLPRRNDLKSVVFTLDETPKKWMDLLSS